METILSEKSKGFVKHVKSLKSTGKIKKYTEIVDALGWDKTSLSNVINGRVNVPDYIYKKFREVYGIKIENPDRLSMEAMLRIDAKCSVLLAGLAEVMAFQKGQTAAKIANDLTMLVNSQLKEKLEKL